MSSPFRKLDDELVTVDGVLLPAAVEWTQTLDDPPVAVRLVLRADADGYRVTHLSLDGQPDVTGETLRRLPLRALVVRAEQWAIDEFLPNAPPHDDVPALTAWAYRLGLRLGEAPVQRVAETLQVSRSTATRKVAEARALGLIGDDERAPQGAAAARRSQRVGQSE